MELLSKEEINTIAKKFGYDKAVKWKIEEFAEKIIGYLGDHLKLTIEVKGDEINELNCFVKCMPRFDKWKAKYLEDLRFFYKEYVMLSQLFPEFQNEDGTKKWRPKLLYLREDLFVFEDVTHFGYKMPHHQLTMTFTALQATVKALARFHAQSFIYEEKKTKELGKPYRIWEDFSEFLKEPKEGKDWRDTGRNAVMDFVKTFSKYKSEPDFIEKVEAVIPILFDRALAIMKPSNECRNTVVHRDLWTNNIFVKEAEQSELHVLMVDFQTVLYASPMLDLSSVIYFNTTKADRQKYGSELINTYHDTLSSILEEACLDINNIFPKDTLMKAYNESVIFGIIQAAIIVPITTMSSEKREEIFCDPEKSVKANVVSRSQEFIEVAMEDSAYYERLNDLFDDIIEMYIYPKETNSISKLITNIKL